MPGITRANVYCPAPFVFCFCSSLVARLCKVTSASGTTAPDWSVAVPNMTAVEADWPNAGLGMLHRRRRNTNSPSAALLVVFIAPPPASRLVKILVQTGQKEGERSFSAQPRFPRCRIVKATGCMHRTVHQEHYTPLVPPSDCPLPRPHTYALERRHTPLPRLLSSAIWPSALRGP